VTAGEQLKQDRNRLGITTRQVEEYSKHIAEAERNEDFCISNAWITRIETDSSIVPSIHKLYSLATIYRLKFTDLLRWYGLDLDNMSKYHMSMPLPRTYLAQHDVYDEHRTVGFPVRFDPGFRADKTNLVSRMVEMWGDIPVAVLQHLDLQKSLYGYIGLSDCSLAPLIRPGSFVQIDDQQNRVQQGHWPTEFHRPVYFIELRDAYACSWCEVHGKQLTLIPHPSSGCAIRQFTLPTEAEVLGRVTAVAMRIVDAPSGSTRQELRAQS
jgi:transcriptional regulator with XRE-family HTH domain